MKHGKAYTLDYRRKRAGRTNYKKRLTLLSSRKLRIVVRRMLNNVIVQIVQYDKSGDKVLVSAHTRELLKYGWKGHKGNLSAAYLVGLLCGLKAKKKGLNAGVLDLGLNRAITGSGFFAVAKGLKDSKFDVSVSEDVLPDENRVMGKHIDEYATKLKGKKEYEKQFSKYIKSGLKPEDFSKHVAEVKSKITEKWR